MAIHSYTRTYTCMQSHTHTHIYSYIHTYAHIYIRINIHIYHHHHHHHAPSQTESWLHSQEQAARCIGLYVNSDKTIFLCTNQNKVWKDMIPFQFNENWFSFFVADHLLVDQLCTNPKSDRSLLSCLKVTQCSTSEIGDASLYNSCSLPIQVMTTGSLPAPSKCKCKISWITGTCPGWWKQSFRLQLWSLVWFQVRVTSHLRSRLESQHQSVPGCAEECGDALVQSGGRWQTLGVAAGLDAGPQVQRDQGLASGVLRLSTLLSLAPSSPDLNSLDYFVWSYVENITNMTSHNTKASLIAAIRRAPTGDCGKGMLPVPDPYWGGDWAWGWLHWIDVSSTT